MNDIIDPSARQVQPEGLSLAIVVVSLLCLFFSILAVAGRTYVRLDDGLFGLDDGLVVIGTLAYAADVGIAVYAAHVGVGTVNAKLNAWMMEEAPKFFTVWILVYVISLATLKSSICVTLLRIGSAKDSLRIAVRVLLAITWASFTVTFVGVLLYCRPIEANWDVSLILEGKGSCADTKVMIGLSHTATASTLLTDLGCVVLPGMILWNIQMERRAKLSVFALLSFASLASIMTICRAPFISHYATPQEDLMYWVGHIVLFSTIETAIACIASSVPMIRLFFVRTRAPGLSGGKSPEPFNASSSIITFGSMPLDRVGKSKGMFRNPTDQGRSYASVHAKGDWERLQDAASDKDLLEDHGSSKQAKGIRADYTYSVELSHSPKHATGFLDGNGK
ncbi:hypothetical protein JX266_006992 [Neoarthrinium moseri]|uniref:uncharacterized protein n=1 Tax=Neoarthrinium moseri TaxID=1658444 RepID=UPI001FDB2DD5|nr:uncharacterized protein JN550_002840 [Neoarthrinium moseri]KAI1847117.1 hypothetical protein JX266_006992 [Neoarthrinium moseri]KAI1874261.1 hypothetical protein JN550_002840 [Neoarthrinium moseri]